MKINNAIIHYYPLSPFVAKASVNLRWDNKIALRAVLRDDEACRDWLARQGYQDLRIRTITHC